MTEHRRLVASARSLATARSRKSATGTRENENENEIRKGIAIETGTGTGTETRTETRKRTETGIMTENATETVIVIVIVTVTVIATVIATRTETAVPGTTAGMKIVAQRATTDVSANGTGKVTRHETVVTEIEIDTRDGDQVLEGKTGKDVPGRRRKSVAAMTNHERRGRQKLRSEARKCVKFYEQESVNLFLILTRSQRARYDTEAPSKDRSRRAETPEEGEI